MPNKKERPHNGRQKLFIEYYCEGETKGNITQSMVKAGYTAKYADSRGCRMLGLVGISEEIASRQAEIADIEQITIESINKAFAKQLKLCIDAKDRPTAARILENQAKHVGYYEKDHSQREQLAPTLSPEEQDQVNAAVIKLVPGGRRNTA